jgi:hypothetical protein
VRPVSPSGPAPFPSHHVEERLLPLKHSVRHLLDPRTTFLTRIPRLRVGLDPSGDGRFMLVPVGATDTYDVTLFGKRRRSRGHVPMDDPSGRATRRPEERQSALPRRHFVGPTLSIRGQRSFCVDLGSQGPQGRSRKT